MGNSFYLCRERPSQQPAANPHLAKDKPSFVVQRETAFKHRNSRYGRYVPCQYLGRGTYGCTVEVFLRDRTTERYTQKITKIDELVEPLMLFNPSIMRELATWRCFVAHKLVRFDDNKMYVLMEKLECGDLYSFMHRNREQITEPLIREILVQVVQMLEKLHQRGLIYRNLRPENILFSSVSGAIKMTELCFCLSQSSSQSYFGAAEYTAPEIFAQTKPYKNGIDIWTLGILAYELLVGVTPFAAPSLDQIKQNILIFYLGKLEFPDKILVSTHIFDLISKMLDPNPQTRLTIEQIKRHAFFEDEKWEQNRRAKTQVNVKQRTSCQDYCPPNRIVYKNLDKFDFIRRQFSDIVLEPKSSRQT